MPLEAIAVKLALTNEEITFLEVILGTFQDPSSGNIFDLGQTKRFANLQASLKNTRIQSSLISPQTTMTAIKELSKRRLMSVLDASYAIEEVLVDQGFPSTPAAYVEWRETVLRCLERCESMVKEIANGLSNCVIHEQMLASPTSSHSVPSDSPPPADPTLQRVVDACEVFGVDTVECIYWRIGAFCYMCCEEWRTQERWAELTAVTTTGSETGGVTVGGIDMMRSGIAALSSVRSIRQLLYSRSISSAPTATAGVGVDGVASLSEALTSLAVSRTQTHAEIPDTDDDSLVQAGIFSDTHLLSIVYQGELNLLLASCIETITDPSLSPEMEQHRTEGIQLLKKYIHLVESHAQLNAAGWDTKRAKELIDSGSK
jgi:hypothetical protein